MDVALLLFLPLIGGYWFSSTWDFTKYKCAREDGHRLYFRAVTYAIILFSVAFICRESLKYFDFYREFEGFVKWLVGPYMEEPGESYKVPILLTSLYALMFGLTFSFVLNKIFPWLSDIAIKQAVKDNDFDRLIYEAGTRLIPMCLTMENNKVFVGYVVKAADPTKERKAIGLLPLMSGRMKENRDIEFTTFYTPIYSELEKNNKEYIVDSVNDFEKVLPVSQIQSASLFDVVMYDFFQKQKAPS